MSGVTLVLATSTGGVGVHVASLARGLGARGWQVRVCGPQATDDLFGFSAAGAAFTPVHIAGAPLDPIASAVVRRSAAGSSLLHAHGLRAATVAAFTRQHPLVVTWHNAVTAGPGMRRRVLALGERHVARAADITLCVSPDLERRVRSLGGRDVRPGPVAAPLREPVRFPTDVRRELGIDSGPLLLSVGRLHQQKGHDVLVEAAAILVRRWPKLRVAIAGDGPQRAELEALIAARHAPVTLLGRRDDVPDLLRAADVLVWASIWEGSPLSVQEALRAGRPLVATRVGGLPEVAGDGAALVCPGDPTALADAISRVLEDEAWAKTLVARAGEVAQRLPTEHDTVAQVEAVYHELLGASH
jgi:glycosyltransferase involved in cell wall biosynthesis